MSLRDAPVTDTVSRCIPRQDGSYWVITRSKRHAVATEELSEGGRIVIRDGKAERAK